MRTVVWTTRLMEAAQDTINFNNAGWYCVAFDSTGGRSKGGRVFYLLRNGVELWLGFLGHN